MSTPSRRSLLVQHAVHSDVNDNRFCTECQFKFSSTSDSAAWLKHWKSFHPKKLEIILQPPPTTPTTTTHIDHLSMPSSSSSITTSTSDTTPLQLISKKRKVSGSLFRGQPSVATLFAVAASQGSHATLARLLTITSIGFRIVETEEFKEFLRELGWTVGLPTRKCLKASMFKQSHELRSNLIRRLASKPITVAADGWTNVRQKKVTNVCLLADGVAYYWCSIVNTHEKNDAKWVAARLSIVFHTLIETHHLHIAALVVDNESVNKATFNLLVSEFPFLIYIPCAAHTVQLAVRSCLTLPSFANTLTQLQSLIRFFDIKENRNALKQQQILRGVPQRVVVKPNDTRWSSTLQAAERILLLRREIECCFDEESLPTIPSKEAFFKSLSDFISFLEPFKFATDKIQNDQATLFTVYTQFTSLLRHTRERNDIEATRHILARWEQRLNVPATLAVAILSFHSLPPSLTDRSQEARRFIQHFGAAYLTYYHLTEKKETEMRAELTNQLALFFSRTGIFISLEEDKAAIQSGEEEFDPRLVWSLYIESSLSRVALVLLSIAASEAAVERSFSAQAAVHSKGRNRLDGKTIQAEMFLKFNYRMMQQSARAHIASRSKSAVVEMDSEFEEDSEDDEVDYFAQPGSHVESEATDQTDSEAESTEEESKESESSETMETEFDSVLSTTASERRRLRRDPSIVHSSLDEFIEWFIKEHHITPSTCWNSDLRNALVRFSSRIPPPVPNAKKIEEMIRSTVTKSGIHYP